MHKVLITVVLFFALAATGAEWAFRVPARSMHCGCAASKDGCEEPCSTCCGPGGYAACYAHPMPNPSAHGCCAPVASRG